MPLQQVLFPVHSTTAPSARLVLIMLQTLREPSTVLFKLGVPNHSEIPSRALQTDQNSVSGNPICQELLLDDYGAETGIFTSFECGTVPTTQDIRPSIVVPHALTSPVSVESYFSLSSSAANGPTTQSKNKLSCGAIAVISVGALFAFATILSVFSRF